MKFKRSVGKLGVLALAVLASALPPSLAFANSNQSLVYQGRIVRPDGSVPNSGFITFSLGVYSPAPSNCLLYSESQSIDMTGSLGMFSLKLGEGTRTIGGTHTLASVFVNGQSYSIGGCSYTAGATDERKLRVTFNDGGSVVNLSAMSIKAVPFALQAHQIDGWGLNNLVKVSSVGSPTTFTTGELANVKAIGALGCAANEVLKWNGTGWACSTDSVGTAPGDAGYGAAAKGLVAFDTNAATSGITVASGVASLSTTGVAGGTYGSVSEIPVISVNAQGRLTSVGTAVVTIPITQLTQTGAGTGQVIKWNGSAWVASADLGITTETDPTVQAWSKNAPAARFDTTGNTLDLATVITAGTFGSATQVPVFKVDSYGRVYEVNMTTITGTSPVGSALSAGQLWVGNASNQAAAVALGGDALLYPNGALTIQSLKGQTLDVSNASAGAILTYNQTLAKWEAAVLPDCTASQTLGFDSILGVYECQTIQNAANFTGSLAGDVTGTQGATTLSRLQGQPVQITSLAARDILQYNGSGWVNANIPVCGANQYLTYNGSYFCGTDTGAGGIVSSIAATGPLAVSNPSGNVTVSFQNQAANQILAGPASGGAAAPAFRSLVADDIPVLDASKIATGTLPVSRGGTGSGAALTNNKVMVSAGGAIVEGNGFDTAKSNNTYVLRDGSGGFAAGAVTVGFFGFERCDFG